MKLVRIYRHSLLLISLSFCFSYAEAMSCKSLSAAFLGAKSSLFFDHNKVKSYKYLGANIVRDSEGKIIGSYFRIWLPNAKNVEVITDVNNWKNDLYKMTYDEYTGNWGIFIDGAKPGSKYKFKIVDINNNTQYRNDPMARLIKRDDPDLDWYSVVIDSKKFKWSDQLFMNSDRKTGKNIMEIHPGTIVPGNKAANYREIADYIVTLFKESGHTTASFMPITHHNVVESWGYQAGALFSVNYRHGIPDDFKYLINKLHKNKIEVIIDLVHSHASKDWDSGLGGLDGTQLYFDKFMGIHPDWDTYHYNYGRTEVKDFLLSNALYWMNEFHVDGFRFDGVASMLYRDYGRKSGEWHPAQDGSNWNYEAIEYIKAFNREVHRFNPKAITIAEESSGYPGVTSVDGLGFDYMWGMGMMHHARSFLKSDPSNRNLFEISEPLKWQERFIPYTNSHDELANGGRFYIDIISDEYEESKFALMRNIEILNSFIYPGHQMNFQGDEFANRGWWNHQTPPNHDLKEQMIYQKMKFFMEQKNIFKLSKENVFFGHTAPGAAKELHIDNKNKVGVWSRVNSDDEVKMIVIQNWSYSGFDNYNIPIPSQGNWEVVFNSDAAEYGGQGTIVEISDLINESMWGSPNIITIKNLPPYSSIILRKK